MRVLVVEKDPVEAARIDGILRNAKMSPYWTDDGEEAISLASNYDFDIISLDINLRNMSGTEVIRTLRARKINTHIIVLTSESGMAVKLRAFGFGADDYLIKPFHPDEYLARLHAIVRRARGLSQSLITAGKITLNIESGVAKVDKTPFHLTKSQFKLLTLFLLRPNTVLSKEMILDHLYGGVNEPSLKIIDVFICSLRKNIADATGDDGYIKTIWGRGYKFEVPEPVLVEAVPTTPDEKKLAYSQLAE